MSEPVAPRPTLLCLIRNLLLCCIIRRNAPSHSLPPPIVPAVETAPIPVSPTDMHDLGGRDYDASAAIDEAQRSHGTAERLGRTAQRTAEQTESSVTWEAPGTIVNLFDNVISGLHTFSDMIDAVSEIHPYVRAAMSAINAVVKPIVNQDARDDAFEKMLEAMVDTYNLVKKQFDPTQTCSEDHSELLIKIFEESEKCAKFIQEEYAAKNFWARAATNAIHGGPVDAKLEEFRASFSNLRQKWRENTLGYLAVQRILDQLKPSPNIGHSTLKACLAKTRLELLRQVSERIRGEASRPVFVVGVAGSGKSSIAHSTAIDFEKTTELGCFFQFDRSERDRTAPRLIPAIAHALAVRDEGYRTAVVRLLQTTPSLATTNDINEQWRQLIQQAGASLSRAKTRLLVVDAFDECPEDDFGTRERLLKLLTDQVDDLPANIRVLITSRPMHGVAEATASAPCIDMASAPANDDIRRYVRHQLPDADRAGLDDSECDFLADAADGLFQWAATACRFLKKHPGGMTIHEKFEEHRKRGTLGREPGRDPLDSLYTTVLSDAFDLSDEIAMGRYRSVMAMVLTASSPLPKAALDFLYRFAVDSTNGSTGHHIVENVLDELGAVITGTSRPDFPVRPMHTSFRDFLVDRVRSDQWHIAPEHIFHGHHLMALGALRHQAHSLTFNMCLFPSSCAANAEVLDLRSRLDGMPAGLEYSACSWEHHVAAITETGPKSDPPNSPSISAIDVIRNPLRIVLLQKFLFWLELLSLCGRVEHAARSLSIASKVFQGAEHHDMQEFLSDATTFARHFCAVMGRSAPHVYLSALPFAPQSSPIRRHFSPSFPRLPVTTPRLPFWPIARDRIPFRTDVTSDWIYCVVCTPDLQLIAGGKDGTVRISSAENAQDLPSYLPSIMPMNLEPGLGKPPAVRAIAYSQTRRLIAAGYANGTIGLWDAITCQLRARLDGHTDKVTCVTFTPEGSETLISGSNDGNVICWDLLNGTMLHEFGGDAAVTGVVFAPARRQIYSSSEDNLRAWDLVTGQPVGEPLEFSPYEISCISYSSGRDCIAVSVSRRGREPPCIQLWDMNTRCKIDELFGHDRLVTSIAWSPDGRLCASGSDDMSLRLWDATVMRPIGEPVLGSTAGVTGVAFSPDGQTLFSSARDCHVRVWNVASIGRAAQHQIGPVYRLTYSTDGRYIRAKYESGQVRCWDTRSGALMPEPADVEWRSPTLSSPDGRISVQFNGKEIILKDRQRGERGGRPVTLLRHFTSGFIGDLMHDRRRFVASSWSNDIRVWDIDSLEELCEAFNTGGSVRSVTFSPDGNEVATGMYNSTVRIWPVSNRLGNHAKFPYANFTPQDIVDENGIEYADVSLRCTSPDIHIPEEYLPSVWMPGMRLLLNAEPLSVDFSNACYGTDWANCYSGNLPSETLETGSESE